MTASHPIAPFPADIDRFAFGHYLSGFADGEGCFALGYHQHFGHHRPGRASPYATARFTIGLRGDDAHVLHLIQSYWRCGTVQLQRWTGGRNPNPKILFRVVHVDSLAHVIIPHFDAFPLHAKKRRDFLIWKEAVLLFHRVSQRPLIGRGYCKGMVPKWTPADIAQFLAFRDALKDTRTYRPS